MIKPLTSLRFFFAFAVFLSHIGFLFENSLFYNKINDAIFTEGYLGVSFFFMLSGFILSLNYKAKLITQEITFNDFWIARVARIYPLHLLTLLIALPLSGVFNITINWIAKLLINLLLLHSFIPMKSVYFSFNAPSWSISDELFFYILFPFLNLIYFKFKKAWVLNVIVLSFIPLGIFLAPTELHHPLFYINPLLRLADFTLGILLYSLFDRLKKVELKLASLGTWFEVFSIVLFGLFFAFHRYIPQGFRFSCYYWIPMSGIILVFAFQSGIFSKLLSNKTFVLMGEISFSFYLLHQVIIRYVTGINNKFSLVDNVYVLFTIILTTSIAASFFSYKYIEVPTNRYIKYKFKNSKYGRGKHAPFIPVLK